MNELDGDLSLTYKQCTKAIKKRYLKALGVKKSGRSVSSDSSSDSDNDSEKSDNGSETEGTDSESEGADSESEGADSESEGADSESEGGEDEEDKIYLAIVNEDDKELARSPLALSATATKLI